MSAIAIIPARGGSKRIARKNLKPFDGVPMIARSIATALRSGLFDQVLVSTDDPQIAELAKASGARVPFMRPAELADDFTGTGPVIVHALNALRERGETFDYACCIYATAPLLQLRYLRQGLAALEAHPEKSFAFSVCSFAFPVQRALTLDEQGALTSLYPEFRNTRSQDLPPAYQDAGQFYWGRSEAWLRGDLVFSPLSLPVILPRHLVQDIDTEEDWLRAEYLYAALKAGGELE
ncbi:MULTISPECIES: pseudaminic acid cytidylyltransferase [Pseudomonas]|uniref:pseudaminic acid cytidylyltransferase n=1 Tax=Pseudomonas TaxID=286 RepID=UPI0007B3414E|nr:MULTISPECIES: pseudaminic acid cytidylyltransferase [Pseudomonas]AZC49252.1 Pseudaminic acid cytidylyltransferase [Pseudomonas chlororaphis subsp. piscium]AZC55879.1 Pseudaminic acid cytidylyltransferase [Pseudomonas chlororaphis subsp. piscium]AZC62139.1 Pseudaminic acid cytidylyltransferase [Pseudomonas chlororaphis subsp. piscium]AZC68377.1 Pseudaminic acid cytidylyltransferase [Pseudomonas chlororaphis subsp. piscium]AZC74566.1 Pseudaminic acid cytidylyltransferase [Pseudomonas chlorora